MKYYLLNNSLPAVKYQKIRLIVNHQYLMTVKDIGINSGIKSQAGNYPT
jgi:hypothetical protein